MARLGRSAPRRLLLLHGPIFASDTALTPNITVGPSASRISRVSSKDVVTFSFQVNEAYQAYKLKVVPGTSSPHTAGTQIEASVPGDPGAGGVANTNRDVNVTDDELVGALGTEGNNIIKVFAQNLVGNWSE